jgi:hypothetical protein
MDKKEGIAGKYMKGNTIDSEDTEVPSASHSFDISAREEHEQIEKRPGLKKGRHFGAHFVFWWVNGEPYLTIGPHCIILNE